MKDRPIITSLLDLDYYKLTMLQWIWKYFPDLRVKMGFKNRTTSVPLAKFIDIGALIDQLEEVRRLKPSYEEVEYLRKQGIFREDFLKYFRDHSLPDYQVWNDREQIHIEVDGKWSDVTLWETIVLSIVNEMYYNSFFPHKGFHIEMHEEGDLRLDKKIQILKLHPEIQFIEFGTRRRYSGSWQGHVTQRLASEIPTQLIGTSNVLLAKELGIKPVGTMAHEPTMALYGFHYETDRPAWWSQNLVLELWWEMYGPPLSIALTDTYTTDFFLKDFADYAKDWRGVRHDSGDPIAFGEKMIAYYKSQQLDAQDKTIVFSDGLDVEKIVQIYKHFNGRIQTLFGWGTNLTNDLGLAPLSLVMKIIESNGHPVVKLSDNPEKATGDPTEVERCKRLVGYDANQYQSETCRY